MSHFTHFVYIASASLKSEDVMSSNTIDPPRLVETLIFDLGDVLFSWSPSTTTSIAPRLLRSILNSATWSQYQTNGIDQSTCYEQCGHEFGATTGELREALGQARTSLVINKKTSELDQGASRSQQTAPGICYV
jgi:hypothetical protein